MQVMRDTGVQFVEVALPDFPYGALADVVIGAEEASIFEPLITSGGVDQLAGCQPGGGPESQSADSRDGVFEGDANSLAAETAVPRTLRRVSTF